MKAWWEAKSKRSTALSMATTTECVMKAWWGLAAIVLVIGLGLTLVAWPAAPESTSDEPIATGPVTNPGDDTGSSAPAPDTFSSGLVRTLTDAGWDRAAARAVVEHHGAWLRALQQHDRRGYNSTIKLLTDFPEKRGLASDLTRRPELLGLLLLVDPETAFELARALDDEDGEVVASLFVAHLAPDDARALARALPGNVAIIAKLLRRGVIGTEALFVFDRAPPGIVSEYLPWLCIVLTEALNTPNPESLAETVVFLLTQGEAIRAWVSARKAGELELMHTWDKLRRAVNARTNSSDAQESLFEYASMPGVWEFLQRQDAEALLNKRGLLAIDLLYGERSYGPMFRDRVAHLLCEEDQSIALLLLGGWNVPALKPFLLHKDVTSNDLRGIAVHLGDDPRQWNDKLVKLLPVLMNDGIAKLRQMIAGKPRDAGALEYVPLYSVYRLGEKYATGEQIDEVDVGLAVFDVATTVAPGAKVVTTIGRAGAKNAGEQAAKDVLKAQIPAALKTQLRREALKTVGGAGATRASYGVVARQRFQQALQFVGSHARHGAAGKPFRLFEVNITPLVQFAFKHSRVGRESFRRLTGLEARLFMRSDARVLLRVNCSIKVPKSTDWIVQFFGESCGEWQDHDERRVRDAGARSAVEPEPERSAEAHRASWAAAAGPLWLASAASLLPTADAPD